MAMLVSGMMASSSQVTEEPAKPIVVVASSSQAAVSRITASTSSQIIDTNQNVESAVRDYFADIPVMAEVAKCESRFRQFEKNGTIFRGRITPKDVGVMQVNEHYHLDRATKLGYDIHTLAGNLAYSRLLYTEEGTDPWSSSSPCWKKSAVAKAMISTSPKSVLAVR